GGSLGPASGGPYNTAAHSVTVNSAGAVESRPANVALQPCVKARKTTLMTTPVTYPPGTTGRILQTLWHRRGDYVNYGAAATPVDDTIPQIGEGVEILTVTIVPQQAASGLRVSALGNFCGSLNTTFVMALHKASA